MINIFAAQAADLPEIEQLLDAGFGPARRNLTAYQLRAGIDQISALCFVARDADGRLVGSVQCWPLQLRCAGGDAMPLTLLGPVVTALDLQGRGIATAMMNAALAAIDSYGSLPALLIGDAPFYGRFGFSAAATAGWMLPGPVDRARLLLRGDASALPAIGWVEPAGTVQRAA